MNRQDRNTSFLVVICILVNCIGKFLRVKCFLPLWLDSAGTCMAACALGPICGALVGATSNILFGLQDATAYSYIHTSIFIGLAMGMCMKKNMMKDLFGAFTCGVVLTMISVAASLPINILKYNGYTSNMWGDGVIDMLKHAEFPNAICYFMGEFCVDFLDKIIVVFLNYLIWSVVRHRKQQDDWSERTKEIAGVRGSIRCIVGIGFLIGVMTLFVKGDFATVFAEHGLDSYSESYTQTIYNNANGLRGGTANDIVETKDGFLWIGTYGGLYQYNGSNFRWMSELESVKTVNCLFVDEEGRLWIGTNDNGVSICVGETVTNVINQENGLPADSIRCIGDDLEGNYYIGTSNALSIISIDNGLNVKKTIEEIRYAFDISTSSQGYVAITTNQGELYILKDTQIVKKLECEQDDQYYKCCYFDENGKLYVGTSNGSIFRMNIQDNTISVEKRYHADELHILNSLYIDEDNRCWICGDAGIGCLDADGKIEYINSPRFNSCVENMTVDYQGNLWFTSSRLGLLELCKSAFTNVYQKNGIDEGVVNSVIEWQGRLYFAMDNGIVIQNAKDNTIYDDELCEELEGTRVRCLKVDSNNHLWICTSEGTGLIEMSPDGEKQVYNEQNGTISSRFRSVHELKDGTIVVAEDTGIDYIKNQKVVHSIGVEDGLVNPKILTILEKDSGVILAGTDGNGISVIQDGKIIDHICCEQGLSSDVVLRMVDDEDGTFIITSNGICFMDETYHVQVFKEVPYYNNFDIVQNENGMLWILGGAGIYVVDRASFIEQRSPRYELLDSKMGLSGSLTANAWNYKDEQGNLYLPCDNGCYRVNIDNYNMASDSYRMMVKYINVDDTRYPVSKSETLQLESDIVKIEIEPALLNYSLNDPYVRYYLEGFDLEPIIVHQSELDRIVYTNLPAGQYVFHIAVMDNRRENIIEASSYSFEIEKPIYEYLWFKTYFLIICILAVCWITWFVARMQSERTISEQEKALVLAKKQAEMGNETIIAIAKAVDAKDANTSQHSERVAEYSVLIAKRLGWEDERCENLRKIALLHDIGKIGIPDSVLNKPSRLTDEEYAIMKTHVTKGAEILKDFTIVDHVADGVCYHHERYDGTGYVKGLKGEEIPINARIIGIADAFDAMTSNRVYRKHLDMDYVMEELKKGSGTQFDPNITAIMIELVEEGIIDVQKRYEEECL